MIIQNFDVPFKNIDDVKEYLEEDPEGIICLLCHKKYKRLGSHINIKHKMSSDEYKELFNIPWSYPLSCITSSGKTRQSVIEAIEDGKMAVPKPTSKQLKNMPWTTYRRKTTFKQKMSMDINMLGKAIRIAAAAHERQLYGKDTPYIFHPLRVMGALAWNDIEGRIVAALHDVIEDSNITMSNLKKEGFSDHILKAIDLLTKRPHDSYWKYIRKLSKNDLAKRVKLADLQDNYRQSKSIDDASRIAKYKKAINMLEK